MDAYPKPFAFLTLTADNTNTWEILAWIACSNTTPVCSMDDRQTTPSLSHLSHVQRQITTWKGMPRNVSLDPMLCEALCGFDLCIDFFDSVFVCTQHPATLTAFRLNCENIFETTCAVTGRAWTSSTQSITNRPDRSSKVLLTKPPPRSRVKQRSC